MGRAKGRSDIPNKLQPLRSATVKMKTAPPGRAAAGAGGAAGTRRAAALDAPSQLVGRRRSGVSDAVEATPFPARQGGRGRPPASTKSNGVVPATEVKRRHTTKPRRLEVGPLPPGAAMGPVSSCPPAPAESVPEPFASPVPSAAGVLMGVQGTEGVLSSCAAAAEPVPTERPVSALLASTECAEGCGPGAEPTVHPAAVPGGGSARKAAEVPSRRSKRRASGSPAEQGGSADEVVRQSPPAGHAAEPATAGPAKKRRRMQISALKKVSAAKQKKPKAGSNKKKARAAEDRKK